MNNNEVWVNVGLFFKKLIETMGEVVTWLFTKQNILSWEIQPIFLLTGGFLIAGIIIAIVRS